MRSMSAGLAVLTMLLVAGCGTARTTTVPPVVELESAVVPYGPGNPTPAKHAAPPATVTAPSASALRLVVSTEAVGLVAGFEGFVSCPYQDVTGVWTRGFGQTHDVGPGSPCISLRAAEAELRGSLETEYLWAIRALGYPFNQHEVTGLLSFAYNLGAGIFTGQLRADLEHGQIYAATRIMLQYDHAGGVVLPGLQARRAEEARVMLTPEPKPRPSRAALLNRRATLRRDLSAHRCRVAPYHGRGRYHAICATWLREGAEVNHELKGTA
jgi:lysozyme